MGNLREVVAFFGRLIRRRWSLVILANVPTDQKAAGR